jgi:hypothetical protein
MALCRRTRHFLSDAEQSTNSREQNRQRRVRERLSINTACHKWSYLKLVRWKPADADSSTEQQKTHCSPPGRALGDARTNESNLRPMRSVVPIQSMVRLMTATASFTSNAGVADNFIPGPDVRCPVCDLSPWLSLPTPRAAPTK